MVLLENVDVVIRGGVVLPMMERGAIDEGLVAIKKDAIVYVGKASKSPKFNAERVIEGKGKAVMPGLVNCHTHVSMTLFRGLAEDQPLPRWLKETIWPLEAKLKPEDIYTGALLGCLEMLKTGTTCFADMYFHEDMVAKAVQELGLRATLAPGIIESQNAMQTEKILNEGITTAMKLHATAQGRIRFQLGPHAVYSCSPELLKRIHEAALKLRVGLHIHLAESMDLARQVKEKYGVTETRLLKKIGFLGPNLLAAHCIYLSNREIKTLAKHQVKVAYNPVANMKLAQGTPKIVDLVKAGVSVGIGTDGPASNNSLDMFQTVKTASLLQKARYGDSTVLPAHQALAMATREGAKVLGIENIVGTLESGKKADLIIIDLKKPHLSPVHDIYANLVYSATGSDVDTVIVNGKILMENRQVTVADEEKILKKAQKTAQNLLVR
ncbi:MAG: amidohydrolase [Candidatus Bathyarchaeia archaeon]